MQTPTRFMEIMIFYKISVLVKTPGSIPKIHNIQRKNSLYLHLSEILGNSA